MIIKVGEEKKEEILKGEKGFASALLECPGRIMEKREWRREKVKGEVN